jgi:hypothetical protein
MQVLPIHKRNFEKQEPDSIRLFKGNIGRLHHITISRSIAIREGFFPSIRDMAFGSMLESAVLSDWYSQTLVSGGA